MTDLIVEIAVLFVSLGASVWYMMAEVKKMVEDQGKRMEQGFRDVVQAIRDMERSVSEAHNRQQEDLTHLRARINGGGK